MSSTLHRNERRCLRIWRPSYSEQHQLQHSTRQFRRRNGWFGSGKTTLMRLITGQIHPQSGKVLIEGRDLAAFSAQELYEHRRLGVLFQHGALFTDLSVFDNIAFPCAN